MNGLHISDVREHEAYASLPIRPRVTSRLVVVLPDVDVREAPLAQRLCALAAQGITHEATSKFADVLLLSACDSWASESSVRLRLALLVALLRDAGLDVSTELRSAVDLDWVAWVRTIHQPGDLLICFAEHHLTLRPTSVFANRANTRSAKHPFSLYQQLSALHFATTELFGYCIVTNPQHRWREGIHHWVAPLSVILVLLVFQVFLVQWTRDWQDWTRKSAFIVTTLLELATVAKLSA